MTDIYTLLLNNIIFFQVLYEKKLTGELEPFDPVTDLDFLKEYFKLDSEKKILEAQEKDALELQKQRALYAAASDKPPVEWAQN